MLLFSHGWAIPRPVFGGFLGSLTNDDATTTPTKKWLIFASEICERFDLFSKLMALKICSGLICNDSVQFEMEMRKISRRRPRSVEGRELGHFTLLFRRGRQKNVQKVITHVHSYFCSLYNTDGPLFSDPQNVLLNGNHRRNFNISALRGRNHR